MKNIWKSISYIFIWSILCSLTLSCGYRTYQPPVEEYTPPEDTTATFYCPAIKPNTTYKNPRCKPKQCPTGEVPLFGIPGACCPRGDSRRYQYAEGICVVKNESCPPGMSMGIFTCEFDDVDTRVQKRTESCDKGNLADCHYIANMLTSGWEHIKADRKLARDILERNCSNGFAESCGLLGKYFTYYNAPLPKSVSTSKKLLALACDSGDAFSCRYLANIYEHDEDNLPKALELRQYACKVADLDCHKIHDIKRKVAPTKVKTTRATTVAQEKVKKRKLTGSKYWCWKRQNPYNCFRLFNEHYPKKGLDQPKTLTQLSNSCFIKKNYNVCGDLGYKLVNKTPTSETPRQRQARITMALEALEIACEEGHDPESCVNIGVQYAWDNEKIQSFEKGHDYMAKACAYGSGLGCAHDAVILRTMYSEKPSKELASALHEAAQKGCEADIGWSCYYLAISYRDNNHDLNINWDRAKKQASSFYSYSCTHHLHPASCIHLAYMNKNYFKKSDFYKYSDMACQLLHPEGCLNLLIYSDDAPLKIFHKILDLTSKSSDLYAEPKEFSYFNQHSEYRRKAQKTDSNSSLLKVLQLIDSQVEVCEENEELKDNCHIITSRYNIAIKTAYKHYRQQCEKDDSNACYTRALISFQGLGPIKPHHKKYTPYLLRGCNLGSADSCFLLATITMYGLRGTDKDPNKARIYAQKSCKVLQSSHKESIEHCRLALQASTYTNTDVDAAIENFKSYCNLLKNNKKAACHTTLQNAIRTLSIYHPETLHAYTTQECKDTNLPFWCALSLRGTSEEMPLEERRSKAKELCDPEQPVNDCSEYGRLLMEEQSASPEAISTLSQACHDNDSPMACYDLALHLLNQKEISRQADGRRALEQGCAQGHGSACRMLGELYMGMGHIKKDKDEAVSFFLKSCNLLEHEGCNLFKNHSFED